MSADRPPSRRELALALLLGAVLFLPGLGARDLWNPDEPRYAEIAREMLASGDLAGWLVPHLNGSIYVEKPPLLFWLIGLAGWLRGGVDETAARLPLALSAVLTLPLLLRMGTTLFGRLAAWLAVTVFGSCVNLMLQARSGQIDMLLLFLVTLAVHCWIRGHEERRGGFVLLFYVAAGLATLAKGPVGLLPPLLSILAYLVASGQRGRLGELRLGRGLGLWALVVLAWFAPAALAGGEEYWRTLLVKQNVQRFADPWGHIQPWYYYLAALPGIFFPWFFLLPSAVALGLRRSGERERRSWLFAVCWVVVTLVFFSLSPGKRTVYILTMYPAMALLIGAAVARLRREPETTRAWIVVPTGLLAALLAVATALAVALPRFGDRVPEVAVLGPGVVRVAVAVLAACAVGALLAFALALARRPVASCIALAGGSAVAGLVAILFLLPPLDPLKSARPLADAYLARAAPDEPYAIFPRLDPQFLFYTRRPATVVRSVDELRRFVARPGRVWVFAEMPRLGRPEPPLGLVEVARDKDPRAGYALLHSVPLAPRSD